PGNQSKVYAAGRYVRAVGYPQDVQRLFDANKDQPTAQYTVNDVDSPDVQEMIRRRKGMGVKKTPKRTSVFSLHDVLSAVIEHRKNKQSGDIKFDLKTKEAAASKAKSKSKSKGKGKSTSGSKRPKMTLAAKWQNLQNSPGKYLNLGTD